jgi:predicted enzyme related to lactoylglutathione lyase
MPRPAFGLVEFPADDAERARAFWSGLLETELPERAPGAGTGWQAATGGADIGVHERGAGPGDRVSLPYLTVDDLPDTLARVVTLGGDVIHPGERWAVCRDCEGNPFALARRD